MSHNHGYVNFATAHNMDYVRSLWRIFGDLKYYSKLSASSQRSKYAHTKTKGGRVMTPSIYDYRDNEISAARLIRRERVKIAVGVILGTPVAVALLAVWMICCAVL